MTRPPARLAEYLRQQPDRCPECVWHVPSQGHAPNCERGAVLAREGMNATADAHPDEAAIVDQVLEAFIAMGRDFSGNDLRRHLQHIEHRNVIGSRIQTFARRGRILDTGARIKATDPDAHAREVRVWRPVA